jgi:ADP-heptose:LPS heptosyltransferase
LIPLFKRSLPDDVEFFERGTVVPEDRYDSHIAIGSLGQYLRPTLESFEGKGGKYLWADSERIQAMREWLSVKEGERVIGLSWRSSNPETGAARSLALKDLVKSLEAPGVRFVNLQYGDVSAEIEALERDEGIQVLQCPGLDTTDDLDGLAALIEACDEVVSIGNATAHLAGALGKKTTVLLPKARSWRWLSETRDTPWYPSASLVRKPTEIRSANN